MLKEIERVGIPVVHICTVTPISVAIGANRIVPAMGIPHPLGDPKQTPEKDYQIRKDLCVRALKTLTVPVDGQTVFEEDID
mgnify:CR=1 FL=1